jgi:hypothetical protein
MYIIFKIRGLKMPVKIMGAARRVIRVVVLMDMSLILIHFGMDWGLNQTMIIQKTTLG